MKYVVKAMTYMILEMTLMTYRSPINCARQDLSGCL